MRFLSKRVTWLIFVTWKQRNDNVKMFSGLGKYLSEAFLRIHWVPGKINNGRNPSTYFQHLNFKLKISSKHLSWTKTEQIVYKEKKSHSGLISLCYNPEYHKPIETCFQRSERKQVWSNNDTPAKISQKCNREIFRSCRGLEYTTMYFF